MIKIKRRHFYEIDLSHCWCTKISHYVFYIDCFVLFSPDIMKDKSFVSEIVCSMWKQHVWYNNTLKDTAYIYLSIYSLLKSVSFPARHFVWNSSFLFSNSNKLCNLLLHGVSFCTAYLFHHWQIFTHSSSNKVDKSKTSTVEILPPTKHCRH